MPTANNTRALWMVLVIVVAALSAGGCSTSDTSNTPGISLISQQGAHPADFLVIHPGYAVADTNQCTACHGDNLNGGISNTSCFTAACHHGTKTGWVVFPPGPPQGHGTSAKKRPGSSGFVSCQICHGNDFLGGAVQVACLNALCHGGNSPHPALWGTGDTYVHMTTDEANTSVCAQCHLNGNNSPIGPPSPPAAPGTPPGCFNNTLCHGGNPLPHPLGSAWVATSPAAQPHGNDAKATPSGSAGFAFCRTCHGTSDGNFDGGIAQVPCLNVLCHGGTGNSPHPAQWFQGDSYEHITTDVGNASECAFCHFDEPNAGNHTPTPPPVGSNPGCFNGTLCHGAGFSVHPAGWFVRPPGPQPHGQSAKAAPSNPAAGFAFCRICHGTTDGNFNGGSVQFSCQIAACHGGSGNSPHASQWREDGGTYSHTSTNTGNAPECGFCHYGESGGGNHPPTPPPAGSGCFNDTLCHG